MKFQVMRNSKLAFSISAKCAYKHIVHKGSKAVYDDENDDTTRKHLQCCAHSLLFQLQELQGSMMQQGSLKEHKHKQWILSLWQRKKYEEQILNIVSLYEKYYKNNDVLTHLKNVGLNIKIWTF